MDYETLVDFFNENEGICLVTGLGIFLYGIMTGYFLGKLYSDEEKDKTKIKAKRTMEEVKEMEEITTIERSTKFQNIKFKNHRFKQDLVDKILNEYSVH